MNIGRFRLVFAILASCNVSAFAETMPVVTYIGTDDFKIQNASAADSYHVNLTVYNLDAHRDLERRISENLPTDFAEAERVANERLKALDGNYVQKTFRSIALTIMWDLKKAPAFVFGEGEQVIYGVTDFVEAMKRWNFYRMRH